MAAAVAAAVAAVVSAAGAPPQPLFSAPPFSPVPLLSPCSSFLAVLAPLVHFLTPFFPAPDFNFLRLLAPFAWCKPGQRGLARWQGVVLLGWHSFTIRYWLHFWVADVGGVSLVYHCPGSRLQTHLVFVDFGCSSGEHAIIVS